MTVLNLKKVLGGSSNIKMPNNLDTMIRRSGLLNKEVAERKGIRPETVSRHISGALQFTIKDAEEYAIILDCSPQDILFAQQACPLFGYLNDAIVTPITAAEKQSAYFLPYPITETNRIIISRHTNNNKKWSNGRMYMFDCSAINKQEVQQTSYMSLSLVLVENQNLPEFAVVYPEPGGTHALSFNVDTHNTTDQSLTTTMDYSKIRTNLKLVWATPILSSHFQPELTGIVEKQF